MTSSFIRDLTIDPRARQARTTQGLQEAASARLLRPVQEIGGYVAEAGGISGGGGFSVNHFALGQYTVTYNTAMASIPITTITPVGGVNVCWRITGVSNALFGVVFYNSSTFAVLDTNFMFISKLL